MSELLEMKEIYGHGDYRINLFIGKQTNLQYGIKVMRGNQLVCEVPFINFKLVESTSITDTQNFGKTYKKSNDSKIDTSFNIHFYYLRDRYNKPSITVCLMVGKSGVTRGVTICSDKDSFAKVKGRELAHKRALMAYSALVCKNIDKHDCLPVAVNRQKHGYRNGEISSVHFLLKSDPNPILSDFEKRILYKPGDKRREPYYTQEEVNKMFGRT